MSMSMFWNHRETNFNRERLKGLFVGYDDSSKASRVYMPTSNKIIVTRDVVFNKFLRLNQSEKSISLQDIPTI